MQLLFGLPSPPPPPRPLIKAFNFDFVPSLTSSFVLLTGENSRKQPWNPHAQGTSQTLLVNSDQPFPVLSKTPQTAHEFTKVWRRQCKTDVQKYQLLLKLGSQELGRIFKAEISMGFLGEFLFILHNCLEDKDAMEVFNILKQLSKTSRFDLSLKFLGEEERNVTSKLIKRLEGTIASESEDNEESDMEMFQELRTIYGVVSSS